MMSFTRLIALLLLTALLSACQSTSQQHMQVIFKTDQLQKHHLSLKAAAVFEGQNLILSGQVKPEHKQGHVECGQLQFQIFDKQGVLLKTATADYEPCHLHYKPNTRRSGKFSVIVNGVQSQALIIHTSLLIKQ